MLYKKKDVSSFNIDPADFGNERNGSFLPKDKLNQNPVSADLAKKLISDQLLDEGNARQNLATFCQTNMDDEAVELMSQTLEKNAIDKSEYPETAEIEKRCVDIIADLWNGNKEENYLGTSTVGSSEACMLAGMAMKFRWRKHAIKRGTDINAKKPNLIISSAYQVCWEKFCVYWDIELRTVPIDKNHLRLNTDTVLDYVDEYTIGIVGILGITYTGQYDDISKLNDIVEDYNKNSNGHELVIHVDGASGGFFAPFTEPDLVWDFRLKNVISISTSGHKYGLVYPGIGWVIWRSPEYLPKELTFEVSYLGGTVPTVGINFSRSASQIIGQYYCFLRFGYDGYVEIQKSTQDVAMFISKAIEKTGLFNIYNDGSHMPVVCYELKKNADVKWSLYDLTDRIAMKGWQTPTYPLPDDLSETIVQRIVYRADFTFNMAEGFIKDFLDAIKELNEAHILFHERKKDTYGFTH